MGKLGGFLQIERHGVPQREPAERAHDYREFLLTRPEGELREQGARCMDCGVPFCHNGCPLGNLIPDWNDLVYRDRWREASEQLHATNNFPDFTGRLCPAAVRGGVRAGDPRGRLGDDQTDRARDRGAGVRRGLDRARAAVAAQPDRPVGRRRSAPGRRAWQPPSSCAARARGHAVRARRGGGRAGALRGTRLQDRKDGRSAPGRPARRRGRAAALRRRRGRGRERGASCASASTRSCSRPARACRATWRCPAASSTECTSRWTTCMGETAGSRASAVPSRPSPAPARAAAPSPPRDRAVVVIGGGDTGADCVGNALREGAELDRAARAAARAARAPARRPHPVAAVAAEVPALLRDGGDAHRGARRAGLLDDDDPPLRAIRTAVWPRCTSPRPRQSRRSAGAGDRARAPGPARAARDGLSRTRAAAARAARRRARRAHQRQGA